MSDCPQASGSVEARHDPRLHRSLVTCLLAVLWIVASCSAGPGLWDLGDEFPKELLNTRWSLKEVVSGEAVTAVPGGIGAPDIDFEEYRPGDGSVEVLVSGFAGCNGYSGQFLVSSGLSPGVTTADECYDLECVRNTGKHEGCEEPGWWFEGPVLDGISQAERMELRDGLLYLIGPEITLVFREAERVDF